MPAGSRATPRPAPGLEVVRVAAIVLLLVVLGLGVLYAYRSQAPSVPEVDVSTALQDTNASRVRAITIIANKATLEFRDSPAHKEQTTVPQPDTVLAPAVADYNAAHPSQPIELKFEGGAQTVGLVSVLPGLVAVLLVGALFYYVMRRGRTP
jgi:ATP-dependent Zn protease